MPEFNTYTVDGSLKLIGELDQCSIPQLDEAIARRSSNTALILDLSELTFVDSSGLRKIYELAQRENGSGPLVLCDPTPAVARVLEIVRMDSDPHIEIRRTRTTAARSRR